MKLICISFFRKRFFLFLVLAFSMPSFSQNQSILSNSQSDFWNKVQFGGGLGLAFGNGYTDIGIAPSAIYNVNEYFAVGPALQFSYASQKNLYNNIVYGISGIVLVNPIPQIQLSVNLNQSYVNYDFNATSFEPAYSLNYWVTSMIIGAGYRSGNVTVGIGYNILNNDPYYDTDPIIPFVRVFF